MSLNKFSFDDKKHHASSARHSNCTLYKLNICNKIYKAFVMFAFPRGNFSRSENGIRLQINRTWVRIPADAMLVFFCVFPRENFCAAQGRVNFELCISSKPIIPGPTP